MFGPRLKSLLAIYLVLVYMVRAECAFLVLYVCTSLLNIILSMIFGDSWFICLYIKQSIAKSKIHSVAILLCLASVLYHNSLPYRLLSFGG